MESRRQGTLIVPGVIGFYKPCRVQLLSGVGGDEMSEDSSVVDPPVGAYYYPAL